MSGSRTRSGTQKSAASRRRDGLQDSGKPTHEPFIDEMVEESFPASDATQLPGRADSHSEHASAGTTQAPTVKPPEREPPRTIGNQGVIPASRERENTVGLNESTHVTLRLDEDRKLLQIALDRADSVLDAQAVDRLIAALSEKRTQMSE